MSDEVFQVLAKTALASSVALILVALLRRPMRIAVGARAAYWLWLLVPAMAVSALLPVPAPMLLSTQVNFIPEQLRSAFTAIGPGDSADAREVFINLALAIWSVGAFTMLVSILARQRVFAKSLGILTRDADGLYRCGLGAPMLVGAWHSKIVVPTDFEIRYSPEEREFIVAHERAHASRHDVGVNAIASGTAQVILVEDGKPATIDTIADDGAYRYRLEITASTSPEKIAAAKMRPSE